MTVYRVTKNVLKGSSEYVYPAYATTGAGSDGLVGGDSIEFLFDNDFILDDAVVQALSSGLNIDIKLFLVYPTGAVLDLTLAALENVTPTTPFQLNDDSSSRNLWFQIPKWTVLRLFLDSVQVAPPGDGAFQLVVVGRG